MTNQEDISTIVRDYGIELERVDDELIMEIFALSVREDNIIDFDDMIYLPTLMSKKKMFDTLFVDESQDLNNCQLALIDGISKRYVFVGDRFQSIYAFRGANDKAVDEIISKYDCETMILPVTYRCPKKHVELINTLFPEIPFICGNDKEGTINTENKDNKSYKNSELILCRNNAPLISTCFKLLKDGYRATVRGRDIGANLVALIKKSKAENIEELDAWMSDWKDKELRNPKLTDSQRDAICDKYDCVILFAYQSKSIVDLKSMIEKIFSDENDRNVVCSSVHKAKGLEHETIRIIKPDLLKMNDQQERNIKYVAYTRSKDLIIID
jgi:superfamily I DNA/RNA helicase